MPALVSILVFGVHSYSPGPKRFILAAGEAHTLTPFSASACLPDQPRYQGMIQARMVGLGSRNSRLAPRGAVGPISLAAESLVTREKWTPAALRARHGVAAGNAPDARPPPRFRVCCRREGQQLRGRRPASRERSEPPAQVRVFPSLACGRRGRDMQQGLHHIAAPAAWAAALAVFLCPPPPAAAEAEPAAALYSRGSGSGGRAQHWSAGGTCAGHPAASSTC